MAVAAIIFAVMVLLAVNIGWWWYYRSMTRYLEAQLSQRLISSAASASLHISPEEVEELQIENLDVYAEILMYLDSMIQIDSLSEASIIDLDFNYLISTRPDIPSEGYLLSQINFDSLQVAIQGRPVASALYNVDGTYLKSAYAPLYNMADEVSAIVVVEAGVGYFGLLDALRHNLFLLAGGSAGAIVILLVFFIFYNRRLAVAEEKVFRAGSQAALGRMVAVVSHEIKNPLMILRAAGERIEKKYSDPEASFIVDEVARLDGIVSGYLSFARGDRQLYFETVDLADLAERMIREFDAQFAENGVELQRHIADNLPPISADKIGIRQVIVNLLLNGLEAAGEEDGTDRRVILDIGNSPNSSKQVILRVLNTGPTIKPSQRERLFEPFYTTKTRGSGLGLYLCRQVVELHHGSIRVADDSEGMTVFEVILPTGARQ